MIRRRLHGPPDSFALRLSQTLWWLKILSCWRPVVHIFYVSWYHWYHWYIWTILDFTKIADLRWFWMILVWKMLDDPAKEMDSSGKTMRNHALLRDFFVVFPWFSGHTPMAFAPTRRQGESHGVQGLAPWNRHNWRLSYEWGFKHQHVGMEVDVADITDTCCLVDAVLGFRHHLYGLSSIFFGIWIINDELLMISSRIVLPYIYIYTYVWDYHR